MIRVLICDDQAIIVDGLEAILKSDPEIRVVGVAFDGEEALRLAVELEPDIVLLDLKMPIMNGVQATAIMRDKLPDIRILVLTTYDIDEWVFDAIRSGAAGYLLKDTTGEKLIATIKETAAGKTVIDSSIAGKLLDYISQESTLPAQTSPIVGLDEREIKMLELIVRGHTNTDIAHMMHLTPGTVRNYLSTLFSKLGVSDRTQAAVFALRHRLVK